jgi:glycerol-3-phosphate dehydrogenase
MLGLESKKVAWTNDELKKLPLIVSKAHQNGCNDVKEISQSELFEKEPNLSRHALGAVVIDGECVADSWIACLCFLHQAINNGAKVLSSEISVRIRHRYGCISSLCS